MISRELLSEFGARLYKYQKGDIIFAEGAWASHYYQIESGMVKMATIGDLGKEVIQGIFDVSESFGEASLLGGCSYSAQAVALDDCSIWVLTKSDFEQLMTGSQGLTKEMIRTLVNRLHYKSELLILISQFHAKERVYRFLKLLARNRQPLGNRYKIKLSRQQIADSLGLRVETTIRVVKELQTEGKLRIQDRKIVLS